MGFRFGNGTRRQALETASTELDDAFEDAVMRLYDQAPPKGQREIAQALCRSFVDVIESINERKL